jgi:heavy metal translocating P-type ATPase
MSTIVKDPVCNMNVDLKTTKWRHVHDGKKFGFCAERCLIRFRESPEKYLKQVSPSASELESMKQVPFICPMHPEVRQMGPGDCPKCGMSLEAESFTLETGPDPELIDMTRRMAVGSILSAPLLMYAMFVVDMNSPQRNEVLIQLFLATPVVFWSGWPILKRAWASIVMKSPNMFTLIGMGVLAAFVLSVVSLLQMLSATSSHTHLPIYFESAAMVITLALVGQVLEIKARKKTTESLRLLAQLAPQKAYRLIGGIKGREEEVELASIHKEDLLVVKAGGSFPVDGIVVSGRSSADESSFTGESMPVLKAEGDDVIGGAVNGDGKIIMRATRVGQETLLAQVLQLVSEAQRSRAPIQEMVDRVSSIFVPAVFVVSMASFVLWFFFGGENAFEQAFVSAISVLIVACPCALGLATPMSIVVATGRAAANGALFRNASAIQKLAKTNRVCLDKTGTLTAGRPDVTVWINLSSLADTEVLRMLAATVSGSVHPLAKGLTEFCRRLGAAPLAVVDHFKAYAGAGMEAKLGGKQILVGSEKFLTDLCVDMTSADRAQYKGFKKNADGSLVLMALEGVFVAVFEMKDHLRPGVPAAVEELKRMKVRVSMLTGDRHESAKAIAKEAGVVEIQSELLPHQKFEIVKAFKANGDCVAMVGDGVNDAPALAEADVGIAMGSGAQVALHSSEMTLVKGDIQTLVRMIKLSRATVNNIRENLILAFGYNLLLIPIAAGALHPAFGISLNPMWAGAAMTFSSVSVIANSLRLKTVSLKGRDA